MEFCQFCQNILKYLSPHSADHDSWRKQEDFRETSSYCNLCKFICFLVEQAGFDLDQWTGVICATFAKSSPTGKIGSNGGRSDMKLWLSEDYEKEIRFAVWCDEGNPAAKLTWTYDDRDYFSNKTEIKVGPCFTTQRPIATNDPIEASTLISSWLQMCLSCQEGHEQCLKTLGGLTRTPGDIVQLPTRILYIESALPTLNVRLVDSVGLQGKYCVLSHCWGPEQNRPLRTFRNNIKAHLHGIPSESLPRTFKEALIITKCIGIDYLWIDSLCVVQDDINDWDRESKIMGSIYENATLMIAASSASDSSKGCGIAERPELRTIDVPITDNENQVLGQCHFSAMPRGETNPELSLLNKRAWCFQERYMSRRKVFFMPGGIVWQCKVTMLEERNRIAHSNFKGRADLSWSSLLSEYTATDLTYVKDRLGAIQGIATEMSATKRPVYRDIYPKDPGIDRGRYQFGVWENSLPEELIWMHNCPPRSGLRCPGIPSWSWASIEGHKTWFFYHNDISAFERIYKTLSMTTSGPININGYIGMKSNVERRGYYCAKVPKPTRKWIPPPSKADTPETIFLEKAIELPVRVILDDCKPYRILGLGHFDENPEPEVFFSILVSAERASGFLARYTVPITIVIPAPGPSIFPRGVKRLDLMGSNVAINRGFSGTLRHTDASVISLEITVDEKYYFALLLKPVDDTLKRFKRVGLGLMYQPAWDVIDKTIKEFEII